MKSLTRVFLSMLVMVFFIPSQLLSQEIRTESDALTIAQEYIETNEQAPSLWKDSTVKNVNPIYSSNNIIVAYEISLENPSRDDNGYIIINTDLNKPKIVTFSVNGKSIVDSLTDYYETKLQETFEEKGLTPIEYKILGSLPSHFAIGVKFNEKPVEKKEFISEDGWYIFSLNYQSVKKLYHLEKRSVSSNKNHISSNFSIREYSSKNFNNIDSNDIKYTGIGFNDFYQEEREWSQGTYDKACHNIGFAGCNPVAWAILLSYWDKNGYPNLIPYNYEKTEDIRPTIEKLRKLLETRNVYDREKKTCEGSSPFRKNEATKKYITKQGYTSSITLTSMSLTNFVGQYESKYWEKVKSEIDNGRPVIANIQAGKKSFGTGNHSVVVYAYGNEQIYYKNGDKSSGMISKKRLRGIVSLKITSKPIEIPTPTTTPPHQYTPPKYYIENIKRTDKRTNIVKSGESIIISFIEGYINDRGTTAPTTTFYWSKNRSLEDNDKKIAEFSTEFSEFGNKKEVYQNNIKIIIPKNTRNGTYYLLIKTNNSKVKYLKLIVKNPLSPSLDSTLTENDLSYLLFKKKKVKISRGYSSSHGGIDYAIPKGTAIYATADGKVSHAGWENANNIKQGLGKYISLYHKNNYKTYYGHLNSIKVKWNQNIKKGQLLGYTGNTGYSTGPHLHFEIRRNCTFTSNCNYNDINPYDENLDLWNESSTPTPTEAIYSIENAKITSSTNKVKAGGSLIISFIQTRINDKENKNIVTGIHLSDDKYLDSNDDRIELNPDSVYSTPKDLRNGRHIQSNIKITIPKGTSSGPHYIILNPNENGKKSQRGRIGKILITVVSNTQVKKDDVYPSNLRLSSSSVNKGDKVKVSVRVNYEGSRTKKEIGKVYTTYYLIYPSGRKEYLGKDSSKIGKNNKYNDEFKNIKTNKLPKGTYTILVVVDDKNGRSSLKETNERNNEQRISLVIKDSGTSSHNRKDDIYPSKLKLSSSTVKKGNKVKLRVRVNYRGNSTKKEVGKIYTSYYIIDSSGHKKFLGKDSSRIGKDNKYSNESIKIRTTRLKAGTYYILVVVDDKNGRSSLKETNEKNNVLSIKLQVKNR